MIRNLLKGILKPKKENTINENLTLIVENKNKEKCFKAFLSKRRLNLLSASNEQEGLKAAVKNKPRLIILNLLLSGRKGLDLCAKIKASKVSKHTLLLIITNNQDDADISEYYANGADRCFKEPVKPKMLLEQIEGLLKCKGGSRNDRPNRN